MSDQMARIVKGIEFLDANRPGWAEDISLSLLDMENPDYCTLGQVVGDYYDALEIFGLTHQDAYTLGFSVLTEAEFLDEEIGGSRDDWNSLTEDWVQEISTRS